MNNLFNGGNTANKRWKIAIPLLSASAVVAGVLVLTSGKEANDSDANALRLAKEELIGEKLQLEKQLAELERKHADAEVLVHDAELRIRELEELSARPQQALRSNAAAASASGNSGNIGRLKRELAGSLDAQDLLRRHLGTAQEDQRKLQEQLDQLRAERDALVARLAQQQTVQLVDNTSVKAVRGKRQQLTTRARRANEIRMAFDMPEHIASNATFKIISPSGKTFEGGDATLSVVSGYEQDEALAARFMLAGGGQERASRVHLHFRPEKRLEAGTYRIEIRSGELYLNTVMLNLR